MLIFKAFFKIAKKTRVSMFLYTGIFLLMCVMFGMYSKDNLGPTATEKCNVVIYDNDNSEASKRLCDYLSTIHNVELDANYSEEDILDRLYYMRIDYVLYINEGYKETGSMTNMKRPSTMVAMYIDSQIRMYENEIKALRLAGYDWDEAYNITLKSLDSSELVSKLGKEKKDSSYYFYAYLPYVLLMVICSGITPILIAFHKRDINDRTNVSPVTLKNKNMQMILATALMSILIWSFFVLVSVIMYGFSAKHIVGILLNSFVFTLLCVGMVSIAGNFSLDSNSIHLGANILGLAMSFLGGIFVPIGYLSETMQKVARFIPTYWYVEANRLIYDGAAISEYIDKICIELLFAVMFFCVALLVSKRMRLGRSN